MALTPGSRRFQRASLPLSPGVRIYETGDGMAVEDPATGVFGTGETFAAAVQDFQKALQDHLDVLLSADALAPPLQRQLDTLQGRVPAVSEPPATRAAEAPQIPPGPAIILVTVTVKYASGASRRLTARYPLNTVFAVDDSGIVAGLQPHTSEEATHEPSVCLIFTGNPAAGGVEVAAEGLA